MALLLVHFSADIFGGCSCLLDRSSALQEWTEWLAQDENQSLAQQYPISEAEWLSGYVWNQGCIIYRNSPSRAAETIKLMQYAIQLLELAPHVSQATMSEMKQGLNAVQLAHAATPVTG